MPGQEGYRYVYAPSHITNILKKIRETNRPTKLTSTHIKKIGFSKMINTQLALKF